MLLFRFRDAKLRHETESILNKFHFLKNFARIKNSDIDSKTVHPVAEYVFDIESVAFADCVHD